MCLGIPGKIVEIFEKNAVKMAKVDFSGVVQEVCIETLPEAKIGNYAIVHAGFALNLLDEEEAKETLDLLNELSMIDEDN
jgi:hydrogenase expression/formation protein HypC